MDHSRKKLVKKKDYLWSPEQYPHTCVDQPNMLIQTRHHSIEKLLLNVLKQERTLMHQDANSTLPGNRESEQIEDLLCHTEKSSIITYCG